MTEEFLGWHLDCLTGGDCTQLIKGSWSTQLGCHSKTETNNFVSSCRAQSQGLVLREGSLHEAETNGDGAVPGPGENSDFSMNYLD